MLLPVTCDWLAGQRPNGKVGEGEKRSLRFVAVRMRGSRSILMLGIPVSGIELFSLVTGCFIRSDHGINSPHIKPRYKQGINGASNSVPMQYNQHPCPVSLWSQKNWESVQQVTLYRQKLGLIRNPVLSVAKYVLSVVSSSQQLCTASKSVQLLTQSCQ